MADFGKVFATTGRAGRFGPVQVDVITNITSNRAVARTEVSLESGAPVTLHTQSIPVPVVVSVMASDLSPYAIPGLLWELNHAIKVRERMTELQASREPFKFFDGGKRWKGINGGTEVWLIDNIAETEDPTMAGVWRAQITLGELPLFSTAFTALDPNVASELQDSTDGVVDGGAQATEVIDADAASAIAF